MVYWFSMIFAIIGAGAILFALGFVTAVIGGLVNGMVVLMSAPLIDGIIARRSRASAPLAPPAPVSKRS